MSELINCPFCGSGIDNSRPVPFPIKRDRSVWVARCGNPDCAAEIEAGSPDEATQRWNRRTPQPVTPAGGEVVAVAVEAFLASTGQAHTVTQLQRDLTTKCMQAALAAIAEAE